MYGVKYVRDASNRSVVTNTGDIWRKNTTNTMDFHSTGLGQTYKYTPVTV